MHGNNEGLSSNPASSHDPCLTRRRYAKPNMKFVHGHIEYLDKVRLGSVPFGASSN